MPDDLEVIEQALAWMQAGRPVVLATVVRTWGSAPRPAGSLMACTAEGDFCGSVSGGCVENAVLSEAAALLPGGSPRLLKFGVSDETAWEVGLACGGRVEVHIQAVDPDLDLLKQLVTLARAGAAPVLALEVDSGRRRVLVPRTGEERPDPLLPQAVLDEAEDVVALDRAGHVEEGDQAWLLRPFNPAPRLILVGAVHVAQTLAPIAARAGLSVTVVDPREQWLTEFRFPGVETVRSWPQAALAELAPDHRTAIVTLTHDPKVDDPALSAALNSPAFYVGALGSRRTHARRRARLEEAGVSAEALDRVHAPVGLDLGARTPPEIAVSILAQVLLRLRRGPRASIA